MIFNTGAALLDAIVLAVVSKNSEGSYGYKITQDVREAIDISESTLYPVLRRMEKDNFLEVYDIEYGGRNRRYYKVTAKGLVRLKLYYEEWKSYSKKINKMFGDGIITKIDFMNRLKELLEDFPTEERESALTYYDDYFEDAGIENTDDIISESGSHEKVAASIKSDMNDNT
ncbi:MAG: PadR family transcriptional regulator, regulatory protein PadR [Lacrimispora sp.]|jgi:PadR family transcriptional regulator PadR|nr:PadR family transcriptional regulator, regulatory protein PadR [Lacrimispora sp.]